MIFNAIEIWFLFFFASKINYWSLPGTHFFREDFNSETKASSLLDICEDGKIDAGVRTIDGKIYLFKRSGFVIIDPDGDKTNESYITNMTFEQMPFKPEYAITITDQNNVRYGLSLFYKVTKVLNI